MILEVCGVSFSYPSRKILDCVSFSLRPGEVMAILGPNGAGKSTLLKCINHILAPDGGCVLAGGEDVSEMTRMERARIMSYVTQNSEAVRMKVFESVLLGRRPYVTADASPKDYAIAEKVISLMGLEHISMRFMDEISGGERQSVQIARALAQEPKVMLLDEPTNNLDIKNRYDILDTVRRVAKAHGISVIMVIHDINPALRFADRIAMMSGGEIRYLGDRSVVTPVSLKEIYGIDAIIAEVEGIPVAVPLPRKDPEKDFFDSNAERWDEISVHDPDIVERIADLLDLEGDETVLDVGTGTGVMIPYYRRRTSGGITAVDFSERMLAVAERKYPAEEYGVEYVVSDITDYRPGRRFDAVVCYSCFPHFPDKESAVAHLASLTAPGGKLMISHGCSRDRINRVHESAGDAVREDRLPDMRTLERMLESNGFSVVREFDDDSMYGIVGRLPRGPLSLRGFRECEAPDREALQNYYQAMTYMRAIRGVRVEEFKKPWLKFYNPECTPESIEYPDISIYEIVHRTAEKLPDECAYEFLDRRTSYRDFMRRVDHVAACLRKIGVRQGDRVLVCLPNCPQAVDAFYAISKIGAISAMIHPLSAKNEIQYYLNNSGARIALVLDPFVNNFAAVKDQTPLEKLIVTSIKDELSFFKGIGFSVKFGRKIPKYVKQDYMMLWKDFLKVTDDDTVDVPENRGKDGCVILYSGGTTGRSKGMLLSNLNLNSLAMGTVAISECVPFMVEEAYKGGMKELLKVRKYIVLSVMPLFHGFGLGIGVHTFLSLGGTCILVPMFTPESYARLIKEKRPNFIAGVPTLFEKMMGLDILKDADMSCLDGIFSGGDSLPAETRKAFNEFLAAHNGKTVIREGYGLTECVTASCLTPKNYYKEGSIGIPFPDVLYKIVRLDTEEELPYGEEGEICISGPDVMIGYWGDDEETKEDNAKALRTHSDGRVWLHTGDAGFMDEDGFVYFRQRYKRIIVSSGYNIYPSQIEDAVNKHPAVHLSCAIGIPDPVRQQVVKVFVVLNPGYVGDDRMREELIAHCREYVSAYAVPKVYEFIDEIPMTKVGKVAFTVLEDMERRRREAGNDADTGALRRWTGPIDPQRMKRRGPRQDSGVFPDLFSEDRKYSPSALRSILSGSNFIV